MDERKPKKKEKNIQFTTFGNTANIAKYFEKLMSAP